MDDKTAIETLRLLVGKCGTDGQVDAIQAIEALGRVRERVALAQLHNRTHYLGASFTALVEDLCVLTSEAWQPRGYGANSPEQEPKP